MFLTTILIGVVCARASYLWANANSDPVASDLQSAGLHGALVVCRK